MQRYLTSLAMRETRKSKSPGNLPYLVRTTITISAGEDVERESTEPFSDVGGDGVSIEINQHGGL